MLKQKLCAFNDLSIFGVEFIIILKLKPISVPEVVVSAEESMLGEITLSPYQLLTAICYLRSERLSSYNHTTIQLLNIKIDC